MTPYNDKAARKSRQAHSQLITKNISEKKQRALFSLSDAIDFPVQMAEKGVHLDPEKLCCSICLDPLKDPVTNPCGHSYCVSCIKGFWDEEDQKKTHSCPQCMETSTQKPVLLKNTTSADLAQELKKTESQAAPADRCFEEPESVPCDVRCQASYCEYQLQLHKESRTLRKHKLVNLTETPRENICSRHNRVRSVFCRTDQQCICNLCSADEHKGHDTVSGAAERNERERELKGSRQNIQQGIQDREKDVKLLQQQVEAINDSADKAVKESEKIFTELIRLMEKRSSDVKQQVRSQQKSEVSRVRELQEKLEREITELKRKDAELEELSHAADDAYFLQSKTSFAGLDESAHSPTSNAPPVQYFKDVTAAVSEMREKLRVILHEERPKVARAVTEADVLLTPPQPKTRAEFLQYSCPITLDPNTVHTHVLLSGGNRKATLVKKPQLYPWHPDRFAERWQVLSREALTGRCYWEVKRSGVEVFIAVAYKDIGRTGPFDACAFGNNCKSWGLASYKNGYHFKHSNIKTSVSGPLSSRIGVYLDHSAGVLSFYSVSEAMTLLHGVQTTFTQPLYAGFWLPNTKGDTVELCSMR